MEGRIMITGGAGFLGRAIVTKAIEEGWNAQFIIFSRDEQKQEQMKRKFGKRGTMLRYVIGDVCDIDSLDMAVAGVDTVIHAGAIKYIPEAEYNVHACITVNLLGSMNLLQVARRHEILRVIGISTDKAVSPLNVYGATKMLMERTFQEADCYSEQSGAETRFVTVRYGNVVGSTGSVIPKFIEQAKELGEVTVTDPTMTRFWISAFDAVDLIDHAFWNPVPRGSTIIPMPHSMKIHDLVKAVTPKGTKIKVTGIRPGEKMHEDLLNQYECVRAVRSADDVIYLLPPWENQEKPTFERFSSEDADEISISEMNQMVRLGARI